MPVELPSDWQRTSPTAVVIFLGRFARRVATHGLPAIVPLVARLLDERWGFDLTEYYVVVMSFIAPIVPALVGTVIGFLLLDQRDDDSLTGLRPPSGRLRGWTGQRTWRVSDFDSCCRSSTSWVPRW